MINKNSLINKLWIPALAVGIGSGLFGCDEDSPHNSEVGIAEAKSSQIIPEWLEERGVPQDSSAKYDERFMNLGWGEDYQDIPDLFRKGLTPGVANSYDERFDKHDVVELFRSGILPQLANQYDKRIAWYDIQKLHKEKISPEVANSYDLDVFNRWNIKEAIELELSPDRAREYDSRFDAKQRLNLHKNNIPPRIADSYDVSFSDSDIVGLHNAEIPIETANRFRQLNELFGVRIGAKDIIRYVGENVLYETVAKRARELSFDQSILR